MPNHTRLYISLKRDPALAATRVSVGKQKLVYVLVADKRLRYPRGKSRIAYVGTTKRGLLRVAGSVASRADEILAVPGVQSFVARIVTCQPRQRVKTWQVLERALLLKFREIYGASPRCNYHGRRLKPGDEFEYFHPRRVKAIIEDLS
jgi:hypothetical protein